MTQTISGTNGNDIINGTNAGDVINAGGGNDTVSSGNGNDVVYAGTGNDTVNAGNGNDQVYGGSGNDTINGENGNDALYGEAGNDTIDGGNGDDLIAGDDGNDILKGGLGNDLISGGGGNDTLTGGKGNDLLYGGAGTDTAIFAGSYSTYDILNILGLVFINGQDGSDLTLDVEYLKFDDGLYNVATHAFTPNQPPALPLVSVVATDGAGTEAIDGTDFTYTFQRTGDLSQALTVNYSIFPAPVNGATPGMDFPAQSGTITFAAGSSTAVLQFSAIDDAIVENTELFSVVVGVGAGYQVDIPNATAGGQIIDNDAYPPAVVSLTPAVAETTEGGALSFTFTRSGGNLAAVLTVNYIVNDGPPLGGATRADGDFSYPSGIQQITFAAGQTVATITVQTNDDANVETDESFPVLLAGGVDYTVDPVNNGSTAVIHDNDVYPPAVVALTPAVAETTEGGALSFTFTRSGGNLAAALTVNYIVNDGPPLGGATRADGDFSYPSGIQQITFAAGQTVATITVQTNDDANVETDESFPVLLAGGVDYTVDPVNNGSTAVIHDNDVAPLVSVVATDGAGTETVDGTDFVFTFSRTGDPSQALTVNYSIFPAPIDGATPGADFPAQSGTITFAAGSSTAVLQFSAIDDAIVENTELFSVVIGVGAGYQVDFPNAAAGGQIVDNDVYPPAVVALTPAVAETTEGGALSFTFTRSGGNLAAALTVNYIVNDGPPLGGATRADGDFSYPSGIQQITFAAGQTVATITVQTNDDANVETDESFPVLLAGGVDYTVDPVNNGSTAVIHDNDVVATPLVSVVATDGAGTETVDGTDFVFTFSRTGSTANALTVTYTIVPAISDGATPGTDFSAQTGTVTFAAGSATALLSFDATHDAVVENMEFFSVVVAAGAGYDVDTPNATANASIADGTIIGTALADNLIGTADPDAILGLGGDDGLSGGLGADYLDGGAGFDRTIYTNAGAAVNIQLAAGTATIGAVIDTLRGMELARGTAFDDVFNAAGFGTGSTNASSEGTSFNGFEGLGGNDQIFGNNNTRIEYTNATAGVTVTFTTGSSGSVTGNGSVGTDTFSSVFSVRASQFDDLFINAAVANNTFDGQGGFDTVSYASAGAAITANLQTGNASGGGGNDVLRDNLGNVTIESIIGTGFNDTFVASGANRFDGGFGSDTLSMNNAVNNVVTAISIETINGGAGDDTVTFVLNDGSVNQSINLGTGTNTLNLDGTSTAYSLTLFGVNQLNGHAGAINDNLNVLNNVAGTIFDLGAGSADELHMGNSIGVAVFTVYNTESVFGALANGDQIHIGGNSGGVTTVTAGLGPDQIWASADADHFRFTVTGDSANDTPSGGQRDVVFDFDASEDAFVFDHIPGATSLGWVETSFGGVDTVLVDLNGDGTTDGMGNYFGYEMAIALQAHVGTLTSSNFIMLV